MDKSQDSTNPKERLDEILCAYIEAAERQPQQLEDWISKYPEFETELKSFVADYERAPEWFQLGTASRSSGQTTLNAGAKLGMNEIVELLGVGQSKVYRARDTRLKRDVAIKVLPSRFLCDAERVERFQREAEVLASLNHPNIAAIYDLAEFGGSQFLVMELVEGRRLRNG